MKQLEESIKIKILTEMLEKYSGKEVVLIENEKLEEVKRTKMTQPYQVKSYVEELLRKYKIRNNARVVINGSLILIDDQTPKADLFNYRNIAFELIENGFRKIRNKVLNGKTYSQMFDKTTKIIVLLPQFS